MIRTGTARGVRRASLAAIAIAGAAVVAGCGGGGTATPTYAGPTLETPAPSPPLRLLNSLGQPVNLAQYRGKAVLLTFVYTKCPDVCPLMLQKMKATQAKLGTRASELQLVAVSTDPRGDTPAAVNRYLRQRGMTGRIQYLVGSRAQLLPVWRRWGVAAQPDPQSPVLVDHTSFILGISASGLRTTIYPANGEVSWMVNDVPLLAKS